MAFANFKSATQAEAPNHLAAYMAAEKIKSEQKKQAAALRSQNMIGGGMLYNQAMGENSPIFDWMSGVGKGGQPQTGLDGVTNMSDNAYMEGVQPNVQPAAPTSGFDSLTNQSQNMMTQGTNPMTQEAALSQSLAAPGTGGIAFGEGVGGAVLNGTEAAAVTPELTAGASGMAQALPWVGGAVLADKLLNNGRGMNSLTGGGQGGSGDGFDIFDTEIYEDIVGAFFGKGWAWD